jgi:four helix bundle protein
MKENLLVQKSKEFAIQIINLCDNPKDTMSIANQLVRSGTSI